MSARQTYQIPSFSFAVMMPLSLLNQYVVGRGWLSSQESSKRECCSARPTQVFERFQSVVITSGTLSPLDMYKKILSVQPVVVASFQMSFARDVIRPLVVSSCMRIDGQGGVLDSVSTYAMPIFAQVTRGADQALLSSKFDTRSQPTTIRNYGSLLLESARVVPDGIVAFFTSYSYMQEVVREWHSMGVLKSVRSIVRCWST